MSKINREEYDILKGLDDKWKWIARDSDSPGKWFTNSLEVYTDKPEKLDRVWSNGHGSERLNKDFLQFIKWEDEEPYNIQELIEDFEEAVKVNKIFENSTKMALKESEETEVKDKEHTDLMEDFRYGRITPNKVRETIGLVDAESEETEVKDIKWANEEIKKERNLLNDTRYEREVDDLTTGILAGLKRALNILDQLDEPETLSQELPVIPKFVADWIENAKGRHFSMYQAMEEYASEKMKRWLQDYYHSDIFARAWLDGYTVEEEQKYVVKLPMSKNNDNQYAIVDYSGNIWTDALPSKYKLTEEEIRGLTKGDILFEHFAVKVEELEE